MNHTAAVITVSDSCSAGTRQDTSGPRVCAMVEQAGYRVIHTAVVPDDPDPDSKRTGALCGYSAGRFDSHHRGNGTVSPGCHARGHPGGGGPGDSGHSPGDALCQPADYPPGHALPGGGGNPGPVPDRQSARFGKGCKRESGSGAPYPGPRAGDAPGRRSRQNLKKSDCQRQRVLLQ